MAGIFLNGDWKNLANELLGTTSDAYRLLVSEFETVFQDAKNYSLINFGTGTGAEAGLYGFKHNSGYPFYGIMFNKYKGCSIIKREPDGIWLFKSILGI